jgi:hypothetical protein
MEKHMEQTASARTIESPQQQRRCQWTGPKVIDRLRKLFCFPGEGFALVVREGQEFDIIRGTIDGGDILTAAVRVLPVYSLRWLLAYVQDEKEELEREAMISADKVAIYLNSRISACSSPLISI